MTLSATASPPDPEIPSVGGWVWELILKGEADIGYEFRSSTDLIFDPGTLIESLSQANPGSDPSTVTPSNLLTTDGDDVEEVLTALSGNPAEFVRARTIPPEP